MFRSRVSVLTSLSVILLVATTSCEKWPTEGNVGGQVPVTIEPVDWPVSVLLADAAGLEVDVLDSENRSVVNPPVTWQLLTEELASITAEDGTHADVLSLALGWARIRVAVEGAPFAPTSKEDSIRIVLAGVSLLAPGADTTATALDDTIVLTGSGLNANGAGVAGTGLTWRITGDGAVEASAATGDEIEVTARSEGQDTIWVEHAACEGACAANVVVTVAQLADSVAIESSQTVLVADDTVGLTGTAVDRNRHPVGSEVFTWTSTDPAVATVSAAGELAAVGVGQAQVVGTARNGLADTLAIEVLTSGTLEVSITDAPADLLESAVLFLNGVYVLDNQASMGRRYLNPDPFQVDLLTLTDTIATLGVRRVPEGSYSQLFLQVDSARVTLLPEYQFAEGGQTRVLAPPEASADSLGAEIFGTAVVGADAQVHVVIDFDVDGSFPMPEPEAGVVASVGFTPVTRTMNQADAASVAGAVTSPSVDVATERITLRAARTDVVGDTMYTRADAGGEFLFRYMIPGSYRVTMPRAPACHVATPSAIDVTVAAGAAATGLAFSIDPVQVDSIVIQEGDTSINALGYTAELSAVAYEAATPLEGLAVNWESLAPAVVTVNRDGLVTAVTNGVAQIVASTCGAADTVSVTVAQVPASVLVTPAQPETRAGETVQLAAELRDSAGVAIDGATFTWTSADIETATVGVDGLVSAHRSGSVDITATHEASAISGTVTVNIAIGATTQIQVGQIFACALTASGEVSCWGSNNNGQLGTPGDGDWSGAHRPQTIPLPSGPTYVELAVGNYHACVLDTAGDVRCWGEGWPGSLGNGLFQDQYTPVLVERPVGVTFTGLSAGAHFTCATTETGQSYCWGRGHEGRLGNNDPNTNHSTPVPVQQFSGMDFVEIASSNSATCALNSAGTAYCWGSADRGQLGNNSTLQQTVPQTVTMPSGVTFDRLFAADRHFCALTAAGKAYCWGNNGARQVSTTLEDDQYVPVATQNVETFATLGLSGATTCGVRADGSVQCWGANWYGQMGDGTTDSGGAREGVAGLSMVALSQGLSETMCGVTAAGEPYCWGPKHDNALHGTGQSAIMRTPAQTSLANVIDLKVSPEVSCALTGDNKLYCWSYLGNIAGDHRSYALPQQLSLPAGHVFTEIALGWHHLCALADAGAVYCRGYNGNGQLGDGTNTSSTNWVLTQAPEGVTFTSIAAGFYHSCAMGSNGAPYCWGWNNQGALGNGNFDNANLPQAVLVPFGVTITSLSAGSYHSCATTTADDIYCWGSGEYGELGNGTFGNNNIPSQVQDGGLAFDRVSAGDRFTCALTTAGAAYCWGWGGSGELGNGDDWSNYNVPVPVQGGYLFESVTATLGYSACGVDAGADAYCWGGNWQGQLGDGTTNYRGTPAPALNGVSVATMVGTWVTSCMIDTSGSVWCTGRHDHGATAVGLRSYEVLPVRVGGSGSGVASSPVWSGAPTRIAPEVMSADRDGTTSDPQGTARPRLRPDRDRTR